MALKVPQASFAKGELDPQLMKRVTLAAYDSALATARNACISRTGSIFSRPGRKYFVDGAEGDVGYYPPGTNYFTIWNHEEVTVYTIDPLVAIGPTAHGLTADEIATAHFETSGDFVYVFVQGQQTLKFNYVTQTFATGPFIFDYPFTPIAPTLVSITENGSPSGHFVDYFVTLVKNGEEMGILVIPGASTYNLPAAAGQSNTIIVKVSDQTVAQGSDGVTEIRVYRRPQSGGAFGYIGSSSSLATSGSDTRATFEDLGQEADYTINPPSFVDRPIAPAIANADENWYSKTGCIYQQRLMIGDNTNFVGRNKESILASRPGYLNNMYRDFPLNDASAYKLRAGSGGSADVLRMIDADGLVVFTTRGVFLHTGQLNPDNLGLVRKGKWRIKEDVPPLAAPGGLFFVDETTNTIRNLVWSDQLAGYNGKEVSIYSNHLFKEREIVSWGFHEGIDPLLYVAFGDGQIAMFTYEYDQEMRAWTRGDGALKVIQVVPTDVPERTFFLCEINGDYFWELGIKRWVTAADLEADAEARIGESMAYMDSLVTYKNLLNASLAGADTFQLVPVVDQEWDGPLTLTCGTSAIFTNGAGEPGVVGTVFRIFDPDSGVYYDLEVTARTDDNEVTVLPDRELNSSLNDNLRLYQTFTQCAGLFHFAIGEYPAVIADGEIVCSPNNDRDDYTNMPVEGSGRILTLPEGMRAAIVHVGRPIVGDVGTLKVTTVEQAPTQHESLTVNKAYIDVLQSRGLYIGPKFPDHDRVAIMQPIEDFALDYNQEDPEVENRAPQPLTRTYEVTLPGEWQNGGEMCLRQVDPVHFHITAISLDVTVERRSDR